MHPVGSVFLLRAAPDVAQQSNPFFFFFLMQHNYLHYNTKKMQYSAATINTTYNGVLTRLRYKYVYHLQYIGIFTIRF